MTRRCAGMTFTSASCPRPAPRSPMRRAHAPARDMEALVRKHLPLVRRIAWHVHGSMSTIVDVEDLVQIGLVALVEAVGSFEDRGQVTFEQYLHTRVRGSDDRRTAPPGDADPRRDEAAQAVSATPSRR